MNRSESLDKIAPAILKAQRKIGSAIKGSKNPFFKSTYSDLGAVMEACKDACNEEGISILQPLGSDELGSYIETLVLHESGQFLSDKTRVPSGKNMQEFGANSTYARRFALQSMKFIPSEDDDGESAVGRGKGAKGPSTQVPPATVTSPNQTLSTTPQVTSEPKKSSFKKPSTPVTKTETSTGDGGWV